MIITDEVNKLIKNNRVLLQVLLPIFHCVRLMGLRFLDFALMCTKFPYTNIDLGHMHIGVIPAD